MTNLELNNKAKKSANIYEIPNKCRWHGYFAEYIQAWRDAEKYHIKIQLEQMRKTEIEVNKLLK